MLRLPNLACALAVATLPVPQAPAVAKATPRAPSAPAEKLCRFDASIRARETPAPVTLRQIMAEGDTAGPRQLYPAPVVRAAPSATARIVGQRTHAHLPGGKSDSGVPVRMTAISGEWVRIDAVAGDAARGIAPSPAGWVDVRDVYFAMYTFVGFSRPDPGSKRVYQSDDWLRRSKIIRILDCRGEWLKLLTSQNYDERTGRDLYDTYTTAWFRGFCGGSESECAGVIGDEIDFEGEK